jgi:hypothetical protein
VPGPSLQAATDPPCISTRDFTRASPIPEARRLPPRSRYLVKQVEYARQQVRVDPPAVVPDPQDDLTGFDPHGQPDVSAGDGGGLRPLRRRAAMPEENRIAIVQHYLDALAGDANAEPIIRACWAVGPQS